MLMGPNQQLINGKYTNQLHSQTIVCSYSALTFVHRWVIISRINYEYHYGDVIIGAIASQITSLTIVYSTVYLDADQSKHQTAASLAFGRGIHRGPVHSPNKWPVTLKMFPFDDVVV